MYPEPLFWGITLYDILLLMGILIAFITFRIISSKMNFPNKVTRFFFTVSGISVIAGLLGAVFFQDIYHWLKTGKFDLFNGLTFLGGLISAIIVFLSIFLWKAKDEEKAYFKSFLQIAPICICFAHGMGRIGCFMAGCCYGKPSQIGLGVVYPTSSYLGSLYPNIPLIPTQLYEAIFLFLLGGVLLLLLKKKKRINEIIYCFGYGIFRFILEFFRGDDREGIKMLLSPSQIISILLLILGFVLLVLKIKEKQNKKAQ